VVFPRLHFITDSGWDYQESTLVAYDVGRRKDAYRGGDREHHVFMEGGDPCRRVVDPQGHNFRLADDALDCIVREVILLG
jgi:hypothetical protein